MSALVDSISNIRHKVGDTFEFMGHSIGRKLGVFEESGTIFLTGAKGVIEYRVAKRLLDAGYPQVRIGCKNTDDVEDLKKQGAEIVEFQWDREDTYEKALDGVTSVLCTTPYIKGWLTQFPEFLEVCDRQGIKNFIKVSFFHTRHRDDFQEPLLRLHKMCDTLLTDSGISYTILAATHFMSNPLKFQGKEIRRAKAAMYYGACTEHGVNYVSPNDVADVAVRVSLDPKPHHGKIYDLTGPETIKDKDVAELLGKYLNKPVMYFEKPLDFFETTDKLPVWVVQDLVALERLKASGKEDLMQFISKDIEKICGRPAETFEEYLTAADRMTPQELAE